MMYVDKFLNNSEENLAKAYIALMADYHKTYPVKFCAKMMKDIIKGQVQVCKPLQNFEACLSILKEGF